jgi:hypothetical protein
MSSTTVPTMKISPDQEANASADEDTTSVTSFSSLEDTNEYDQNQLTVPNGTLHIPFIARPRSPHSGRRGTSPIRYISPIRRSRSHQQIRTTGVNGTLRGAAAKNANAHAEAVIRALRKKLQDKEAEATMAADIGQMLLKEIDALKIRLERYESPDAAKIEKETVERLIELRRDYDMYTAAIAAASASNSNAGGVGRAAGLRKKTMDQSVDRPSLSSILDEESRLAADAALQSAIKDQHIHTQLAIATEMGIDLLQQAAKLRTDIIHLEEARARLEELSSEQQREIEQLRIQVKRGAELEERAQDATWNLELANQELRAQIQALQQQQAKATHEHGKTQHALAIATDNIEQLKEQEGKLKLQLERAKLRHEQEMSDMRQVINVLEREKAELHKKVEQLKQDLANRSVPTTTRPQTPDTSAHADAEAAAAAAEAPLRQC